MCCADTDAAKDGSTKEATSRFWLCILLVAISFEHGNAYCLYFGNGCNFPVSI